VRGAVAILFLSACASSAAPAPPPAAPTPGLAATEWDAMLPPPGSRSIDSPPEVRRIRPHRAPDGRPPVRRSRIDASFAGADLTDALRLLADAGGLALVVGEGVQGTVDIDLRAVDPFDAMVALAEAHGASVSVRGRIVVVSARR
jgi:hypothetical protein